MDNNNEKNVNLIIYARIFYYKIVIKKSNKFNYTTHNFPHISDHTFGTNVQRKPAIFQLKKI